MQVSLSLRGLVSVLVVLLFVPGQASAQLPKDEQKCVLELNKQLQKLAATQGKDAVSCVKNFSKDKTAELGSPTPSAEACLTQDVKGKLAKASAKAVSKIASRCAQPPSFGQSDPNAIIDIAVQKELALVHDIFGSALNGVDKLGPLVLQADDKERAKCQLDGLKAAEKCQVAKLKQFISCKKEALKDGTATSSAEVQQVCMESLDLQSTGGDVYGGIPDPKGKIQKACQEKLVDKLQKKCSNDLDAFPGCNDPNAPASAAALGACLDRLVECRACLALNDADGLARNCDLFDDGLANQSCLTDLTVANLNILHGAFCPPDECRQSDRVDLFFQWVASSGCPDIVTLQEVIQIGEFDMVTLLQAQLGTVCPFTYEFVFQPTTGIDEEVIMSRYPVVTTDQEVLFQGFRKVLYARVDHPIGPVDIFTTHLASSSDLGNDPCGGSCPSECSDANAPTVRDCQAVQMALFIESVHDVDTPGVVTGDFNNPPGSFVYDQFVGRGWTDTYLAAGNPECNPGTGVGCTSGRESGDLSEIESPAANVGSRIDYTFLIPPGPGSACAGTLDGPSDADGDGTATRIFADDPNPFSPSCGPAPDPVCWPSDHEGTELDLNCD